MNTGQTPNRLLTRPELIKILNDQGCIVLNDESENLVIILPDHLLLEKTRIVKTCDGFCEPMCKFCNRLADEAAEGRVIDQGY
jgi:hypothetical protein